MCRREALQIFYSPTELRPGITTTDGYETTVTVLLLISMQISKTNKTQTTTPRWGKPKKKRHNFLKSLTNLFYNKWPKEQILYGIKQKQNKIQEKKNHKFMRKKESIAYRKTTFSVVVRWVRIS